MLPIFGSENLKLCNCCGIQFNINSIFQPESRQNRAIPIGSIVKITLLTGQHAPGENGYLSIKICNEANYVNCCNAKFLEHLHRHHETIYMTNSQVNDLGMDAFKSNGLEWD